MAGQDGKPMLNYEQTIEAGVGLVAVTPSPGYPNGQQALLMHDQLNSGNDYQNVHP